MADFYLDIGDNTSFTKTVSESDVYQLPVLPAISRQTMSTGSTWRNRAMVA